MLLNIFIIIVAMFMYTFFIGNMTAMMLRANTTIEQHRADLAQVERYLKRRRVPQSLRLLCRTNMQNAFERGDGKEEAVLEKLPRSLRISVLRQINSRVLRRAPLFYRCDKALVAALCGVLRRAVFVKGEVLAREGEVVRELFFLEAGKIKQERAADDDEEEDEDEEVEKERPALVRSLSRGLSGLGQQSSEPSRAWASSGGDEDSARGKWARRAGTSVQRGLHVVGCLKRTNSSSLASGATLATTATATATATGTATAASATPTTVVPLGKPPIGRSSSATRLTNGAARTANESPPTPGGSDPSSSSQEASLYAGGASGCRVRVMAVDDADGDVGSSVHSGNFVKYVSPSERRRNSQSSTADPAPAVPAAGAAAAAAKANEAAAKPGEAGRRAEGASKAAGSRKSTVGWDGDTGSSPAAIEISSPGSALCDVAFIFGVRQHATLTAMQRTTCLALSRAEYKAVAAEFVGEAGKIQNNVLEQVRGGLLPFTLSPPSAPSLLLLLTLKHPPYDSVLERRCVRAARRPTPPQRSWRSCSSSASKASSSNCSTRPPTARSTWCARCCTTRRAPSSALTSATTTGARRCTWPPPKGR